MDSTGAVQNRYVRGDGADELLVDYSGSGTTNRRFASADERGSIISLTDSSGNLVGIDRYDEYGKPQSTNIGRFQYTGQAWLSEANVAYYKARTYLPHLGIFAQTDPLGPQDDANLYAYVLNDPVNLVDPSGLQDGGIQIIGCRHGGTYPNCNPKPQQTLPSSNPAPSNPTRAPGGGSGPAIIIIGIVPIIITANRHHKYVLPYLSPCPASAVFGYFKQSGHSGPGAPAAHEGVTPRILLWPLLPGMHSNPISQYVNSSTRTIINTARPGHVFYPGTVTIQVDPLSDQTSLITITGEGTGADAELNVILGKSWFGAQASAAADVCGR